MDDNTLSVLPYNGVWEDLLSFEQTYEGPGKQYARYQAYQTLQSQ